MHLILIRHGSPDYSDVEKRHYIGQGRDLAKLSEEGIAQAEALSKDERLKGADLILSSPYTRALETAAIISKNLGLSIAVETDLHEWMPDTTFQFSGPKYFEAIRKEMILQKGVHTPECTYHWESMEDLGKRAFSVIEKYKEHEKIIVVCHGVLIRQFRNLEDIPPCSIVAYEYDENSTYLGWMEHAGENYTKKESTSVEEKVQKK